MPAEVPQEFQNEPEFTLWRNIARLFEDYTGGQDSFLRVVGNITSAIAGAECSRDLHDAKPGLQPGHDSAPTCRLLD